MTGNKHEEIFGSTRAYWAALSRPSGVKNNVLFVLACVFLGMRVD